MTNYVRKLISLPNTVELRITSAELEGQTCYRKLEFDAGSKGSHITLYRVLSARLRDRR